MMDFIPMQYRLIAAIAALAIVAAVSATAGAKIATWKAEASCAESRQELTDKVATLTAEVEALKTAVAKANEALAIAKERSDAIEMVQVEAVKVAALKAQSSQERLDRLKAEYAKATTCGEVLNSYWIERR